MYGKFTLTLSMMLVMGVGVVTFSCAEGAVREWYGVRYVPFGSDSENKDKSKKSGIVPYESYDEGNDEGPESGKDAGSYIGEPVSDLGRMVRCYAEKRSAFSAMTEGELKEFEEGPKRIQDFIRRFKEYARYLSNTDEKFRNCMKN